MVKRLSGLLLALCLLFTVIPTAQAAGGEPGAPDDTYATATSFSELKALIEDDSVQAIYVDRNDEDFIIPVEEDIVINKKLCVGNCDLLLRHGVTMTVERYEDNLLFCENGRIVCESEGAAGPDCLTGGTLVLNGTAILSGEPDKGAVNPTRDIVWLSSVGELGTWTYPAAANVLEIGDQSEADVHGDISALPWIAVRMTGRDSRIRLTDDFTCATLMLNGELIAVDCTLNAYGVYYSNDARGSYADAINCDNLSYEVRVETNLYGHYDSPGYAAGQKVYFDELGVPCDRLKADGSFCGWVFNSGWEIPREELDVVKVQEDEAGRSYFIMPDYPLDIYVDWVTAPVELTCYDAAIRFDGIEGHDYEWFYIDSVNTTDGELEALGFDRQTVDDAVALLQEQLGDQSVLLRLLSFAVYDGEEEMIDFAYDLSVALGGAAQDYPFVTILPLFADDENHLLVNNMTIPFAVENGVLTARPERVDSAYIVIGSQQDPRAVGRVELSYERPASGAIVFTPYDERDGWRWREQENRPNVWMQDVRGAYLNEVAWTLADDAATPFDGEICDGMTCGLIITVNAEPDCYFSEDTEVILNGEVYTDCFFHLRDDGLADILTVICTCKPYPAEVRRGDVDGDRNVTILDATHIQRELAGLDNARFVDEAADTDGDGEVTILDATCIQRWLAAYEVPCPIGERIDG